MAEWTVRCRTAFDRQQAMQPLASWSRDDEAAPVSTAPFLFEEVADNVFRH